MTYLANMDNYYFTLLHSNLRPQSAIFRWVMMDIKPSEIFIELGGYGGN